MGLFNMLTNYELMLALRWYDPNDEELVALRKKAHEKIRAFNKNLDLGIIKDLLGSMGEGVEITPDIFIDYGINTFLGDNVYFNTGVVILDSSKVMIGSNVLIGPRVGLYTPTHPLDLKRRQKGIEKAAPIIIEDDVWIAGNVTVLGGVTIHKGAVIAAGSLVNKDVEAHSLYAGSPARFIKSI